MEAALFRQFFDRRIRLLAICVCMHACVAPAAMAQEVIFDEAPTLPSYSENFGLLDTAPAFGQPQATLSCECCPADKFGYGTTGSHTSDCPSASPCLEQSPGRSLYWQDNGFEGYRHEEPIFHHSRRARFYGSIESIALLRDQRGSVATISPGGLLNSNNFETEFDHSLRSTIGVSLGDWYRVDFTWLAQFEWSDRLAATSALQSERLDLRSRFDSAEINLRRRVKIRDWPRHYPDYWNSFEFSTLLGFRHVELDEQLRYRSTSPTGPTNATTVNTANNMSGIQIGGLGQWLYEDRGWLDVEVKGAMLSNDLTVSSSPIAFHSDESRTAFLIDATLMCNYQLSRCITLRLGYNMIWLRGTALATENAPNTTATLDTDHDGESLFHGPSLGLVFAR